MRFHALACDFDGTIAHHGRVDEATLAALERLVASGRKLLLVTGRQLDDLLEVFPHVSLFAWVVAENGALLYQPSTREERLLGDPPPEEFIAALEGRGVHPLSRGRNIVATWRPHEVDVLETICELGLELQVIFNKGAVMVLPPGVNKGTGLRAVLDELRLSPHNVVGVGDAENDHAFLRVCEFAAVVDNALPLLKKRADWVTPSPRGAGVVELIHALLKDDLSSFEAAAARRSIPVGVCADGSELRLPPAGVNVLVAGPSGSGKSTVTSTLLERWTERGYQFCLIDPEGDYDTLEGAVVLGDGRHAPSVSEIVQLLMHPAENVVVNLLALPLSDRPAFFASLLPRLIELRSQVGRPHWLVVDEAHHLLPSGFDPTTRGLPPFLGGLLAVTVHPDHVTASVLSTIDAVFAVGGEPRATLKSFTRPLGLRAPALPASPSLPGGVLAWFKGRDDLPCYLRVPPPRQQRHRHRRKYAVGELGPDKSFYFRGPRQALNLRAQNLALFVQMAEGIDDETWTHHLARGDYSRWFREAIKDEDLANAMDRIEARQDLTPDESRARMKSLVEDRYTGAS